jgi:exonuclease VII small subunit
MKKTKKYLKQQVQRIEEGKMDLQRKLDEASSMLEISFSQYEQQKDEINQLKQQVSKAFLNKYRCV